MKPQYAIMLDTDFLARKIASILKRPAKADDFVEYINYLKSLPIVKDYELLLIYLNDANQKHELDGVIQRTSFNSKSIQSSRKAKDIVSLIKGNALKPSKQWKIRETTLKKHKNITSTAKLEEFALDLDQKGIDMEASIDMANLAMREMLVSIIVVTKNADFIPTFKFVQTMGIQVILDAIGNKVHEELIQNSDVVINSQKFFVKSEV